MTGSMLILRRIMGALACLLMMVACDHAAAANSLARDDAKGRKIEIENTGRIISIGGALTEILYDLGLERQVVAVDTTSVYPPRALKEKPNIGYMRQLSPEGVLSLAPSLILATEGSGPKQAIDVLEAASIPFVVIPDRYDGEGIIQKIELVGAVTGAKHRAECLMSVVHNDLSALAAMRASIKRPARVLFILSFMDDRAMVAGRDTAADGIIRLAGAENAIAEFEGYKPISDEAIVAAHPDAVLTMSRAGFEMTAADVFSRAPFQLTPAAKNKNFIAMEGLYLLGFGPRTARAAADLAHTLYPKAQRPASLDDEQLSRGDCS